MKVKDGLHVHETANAGTAHVVRRIATIRTDFSEKFGIPRQSGLADTKAEIIFDPEYASMEAVRGIEGFSYLWLIWGFSGNADSGWHPTVRPPRLGGNIRMGVFATRSPFRPNGLGLSSVKLDRVENREGVGPVLHVCGADLLDGTPIYDIKPYIPYADVHEDAREGFTGPTKDYSLEVNIGEELLKNSSFPSSKARALKQVLSQDPRPSYQSDPQRIYGMSFAGFEIRFRVQGKVLEVVSITRKPEIKPED
ncbi:MAG: tRNA (N6-threonylcarbamoyladenosine(37)-N6)-methyltransferase TrmO [Eubacterium sp.]|nr:tRNA (N6-threonylcarbamoyladenosine(37)-N6)-methyltransferase TrmO [Eubacterium sp.]